VASGKGGTGKTTIATGLYAALARAKVDVRYVDCDVEEPNGGILLRPESLQTREVGVQVPLVDSVLCTLCGACAQACRFSAIAALPKLVLTFPQLCHSCGACGLACPTGAIHEELRVTGTVHEGTSLGGVFLEGRLNVGEAMSPPVIRALLQEVKEDVGPTGSEGVGRVTILDAPPGTSCPVIATLHRADVVLLVTEPTPFGLNDLELAVGVVRKLGMPFGVVINRADSSDARVQEYCCRQGIEVLLEVPYELEIARAYARGGLALEAWQHGEDALLKLYAQLCRYALPGDELGSAANLRVQSEMLSSERPIEAVESSSEYSHESALPSSRVLEEEQSETLHELVLISGKGGTGKTSIAASLFALSGEGVAADCDVDAANMHLVLSPKVKHRWPFSGGKHAELDVQRCTGCGRCLRHCRFEALQLAGAVVEVDEVSCEGCGVCVDVCPTGALSLQPSLNGEYFLSDTRFGPMVHARLGTAEENSGKLVTVIRREAKALALKEGRRWLVVDGSPGIGCPVIASLSGASLALIVTEPSLSGLHDLERVASLCQQLRVRAAVCVNKADLELELSERIEQRSAELGLLVLARIRVDAAVSRSQRAFRCVVEDDAPVSQDIRVLWKQLQALLEPTPRQEGLEGARI
jgi:MinD superfamily P-loop ATPase